MPSVDRGRGPLRPISYTASEIMARRIVDRLCQQPPYGLSWKEFVVREIARTLAALGRAHTSPAAVLNTGADPCA
jgi:hypothetical protein